MREVLISIQPKWCELIASGKKTVEVRKTRPKIDTPFKCYIYQTKKLWVYSLLRKLGLGRGKVIGEFICTKVDRIVNRGIHNNFDYCYCSLDVFGNDDIETEITAISKSCISKEELNYYGMYSHCLYAWHISDLVIYDKPKELSEFYRWTDYDDSKNDKRPCNMCEYNQFDYSENHEYCSIDYDGEHCVHLQMKRPPQSWCYVELLKVGAE